MSLISRLSVAKGGAQVGFGLRLDGIIGATAAADDRVFRTKEKRHKVKQTTLKVRGEEEPKAYCFPVHGQLNGLKKAFTPRSPLQYTTLYGPSCHKQIRRI